MNALITCKFHILLPGNNRLISNFARESCTNLKKKEANLYYKPREREIVEITKCTIKDKNGKKKEYFGFIVINPTRFVNIIEVYMVPYINVFINNKLTKVLKSLSQSIAKVTLENDCWKELRNIQRIFTAPIPIINNGSLTFPKKGYDGRFSSWLLPEAPEIDESITIKKAKEILKKIYGEFCFKNKQSYTNAISHLLTEFCMGLLPHFNTLKPIFLWEANRERSGKDFGGVIPGLVMEGVAIQDVAISTDSKFGNHTEELRKKITTMLLNGRRRLHSSNNRGCIKNEVLEALATLNVWSDRLLGGNKLVNLDNELIISLSANVGYTATPDFINRTRIIRLHLDIEDPNKRKFKNPNLHEWIKNNRSLILSCLFALVKNWFNEGMPKGKTLFTSFPEWAEVIGGIMVCNDLGDPCVSEDTHLISADRESSDMKEFFELVYSEYPDVYQVKSKLLELLNDNSDYNHLFSYLDFNSRSGSTTFAFLLKKYIGRVFSGIRLDIDRTKKQSRNHKFCFTKTPAPEKNVDIFDNVQNNGEKNVCDNREQPIQPKQRSYTSELNENKINKGIVNVANVDNVALSKDHLQTKVLETLTMLPQLVRDVADVLKEKTGCSHQQFMEILENLDHEGVISVDEDRNVFLIKKLSEKITPKQKIIQILSDNKKQHIETLLEETGATNQDVEFLIDERDIFEIKPGWVKKL
jgi:hypothetical protein